MANTIKEAAKGITKRADDYSQWYLDIIEVAELADNSPVRGCMVIKPYGYAIWEKFQAVLDEMFKETGVANAYFPLFIPLSFFNREAEHVEGFAKECAVVTHHRLELGTDGKLKPAGELDEPLIVRPTSETIIYDTYSKWINSYRDLPLLINQWCNVVRWEMRTRPFLRTMEFLWQEGHTAHASREEAEQRTRQMADIYQKFCEEYLALPIIAGFKTESEKFAGAEYTTCIEAIMQDKKALQAGTSHMLGQNFAKPFNVMFLDSDGERKYVWQTSWGVSTRLIGALIMAHSDDIGLVLPPRIAPIPVVIVPIWASDTEKDQTLAKAQEIRRQLEDGLKIKAQIDEREERPGEKFYHWEKKGVPLRLEIGPKDLLSDSAVAVRRDNGKKEKVKFSDLPEYVEKTLADIQQSLFDRAKQFRQTNTHSVDSYEEFKKVLETEGGFIWSHWCGSAACEARIKEETKATIRCLPFDQEQEEGRCLICGQRSRQRVVFAKAY